MIYFLPFLAAALGWIIHHTVLQFLFYPRKPIRIASFTIQGFLPAKKNALSRQLAALVARHITLDQLIAKIDVAAITTQALPTVEEHLDKFIHTRLKEEIPLLSMFITEKTIGGIKKGVLDEVEAMIPVLIGQMTDRIKNELDIEKMIIERIEAISLQQMEEGIGQSLQKVFLYFKILGAVTGFIIGSILLLILCLSN